MSQGLQYGLLILIISLPIIFVVANKLRMDLAAMIIAAIFGILQYSGYAILGPVNTPSDAIKAISGFSQPVVLTLISLFILTSGLEKSGVTRWIAQKLLKFGGEK
jgi:di/tricarboxylate transporter